MSGVRKVTGVGAVNARGEVVLIIEPLTAVPTALSRTGRMVSIMSGNRIASRESYTPRISRALARSRLAAVCELSEEGEIVRLTQIVVGN